MNYRHAFHAGNFADVVKHAVLALILDHLGRKAAPYFVLDTHAGIGRYDLDGAEAGRTGEWRGGVGRVRAALARGVEPPAELSRWLEALDGINPEGGIRHYPGSPRLTRALLRPADRLVLAESHPEDAALLKREFAGDPQVAVHRRDGWSAPTAFLPPPERRGLVLIDPPYEAPDEAERLAAAFAAGHRRWPTGVFALWYPIKERSWVWRLHDALAATGAPRQLVTELTIRPETDWCRLNGCGLIIVNPPWQLDTALNTLLPWLAEVLAEEPGGGGWRVDWLVPESPPAKAC